MDKINSLKKEIEEKEIMIKELEKEYSKRLDIQIMKEINNNKKLKILKETDFSDREKLIIAVAIGISENPEKAMYSELDDIIKHFQKIKKYSISATIKHIRRYIGVNLHSSKNNSNDCIYICYYYNDGRTTKTYVKPGNPDYHYR